MEIIYITLLTFLASLIGTLTGFGLSTIMIPIVVLFFSLPETLLLVGIIHFFADIWKVVFFNIGIRWRLIFLFGVPGIVCSLIGASLVFFAPDAPLSHVLGGFFIAYTLFLFFNPQFELRQNNQIAIAGGALSGFFAGIFGIGGAIRGAFLSMFNLPKAVYIATAGIIGFATDSARLILYVAYGQRLPSALFWGLFLFIPASLLGAYTASKIAHKINQKQFRTLVVICLFLIGLKLLIWGN